jgi:flagellar hook-associated protein 3 FlgL
MRITNSLVTRDIIANVTGNSAKLNDAQNRVSTGLKVTTISDDPIAGTGIMQASSALRAVDQFRSNVQGVGSELDAEDTALGQVGDILTRAKELAAAQSGATASAASRTAAAAEVKQLIGQVVAIGNTKLGDDYIFGGANSANTPPFDATQGPTYLSQQNGAPVTPTGMRSVEIGAGQTMAGAHDGNTVFVQTGVLSSLQSLYDGLTANDPTQITTAMSAVDGAFNGVQTLVGDVGARQNQVDATVSSLDAYQQNLQTTKSNLSEVDIEQAMTEMVARQTAYQAAMLASSKVMGLSLVNYLS